MSDRMPRCNRFAALSVHTGQVPDRATRSNIRLFLIPHPIAVPIPPRDHWAMIARWPQRSLFYGSAVAAAAHVRRRASDLVSQSLEGTLPNDISYTTYRPLRSAAGAAGTPRAGHAGGHAGRPGRPLAFATADLLRGPNRGQRRKQGHREQAVPDTVQGAHDGTAGRYSQPR